MHAGSIIGPCVPGSDNAAHPKQRMQRVLYAKGAALKETHTDPSTLEFSGYALNSQGFESALQHVGHYLLRPCNLRTVS